MDGLKQDEFQHCTSPGVERIRINLTFPWIKQHFHGCPSLCTVVACGFAIVCEGFVRSAGPWAVRLVVGQGGVDQVPVGNPPRPSRNWDTVARMLHPHFPGGQVVEVYLCLDPPEVTAGTTSTT